MAFAYLSMKQNTHIDKKNCKATAHFLWFFLFSILVHVLPIFIDSAILFKQEFTNSCIDNKSIKSYTMPIPLSIEI